MIGRNTGDGMDDLGQNSLIWRMFMSSTLNAAVHLRKNYLEKLHSIRNQKEKPTEEQLFETSQRLIKDHTEISGVSQIYWQTYLWEGTSSLCEWTVRLSTAKVNVFSDSVLGLGKCSKTHNPMLHERTNLNGSSVPINTDNWIESTALRWNSNGKISQYSLRCRFSTRSRTRWTKWTIQRTNHLDIGHSTDQDQRQNVTEPIRTNRMDNGMKSLKLWWLISAKVDIPYGVEQALWNEEPWRARGLGNCPYISVVVMRQLRLFFALVFLSSARYLRSSRRHMWRMSFAWLWLPSEYGEGSMVSLTDLLNVSKALLTHQRVQGDLLLDHKQRMENLPWDDRLIKLSSDAGFAKTVAAG